MPSATFRRSLCVDEGAVLGTFAVTLRLGGGVSRTRDDGPPCRRCSRQKREQNVRRGMIYVFGRRQRR